MKIVSLSICLFGLLASANPLNKTEASICLGCESQKIKSLPKLPLQKCHMKVDSNKLKNVALNDKSENYQISDSPTSRTSNSVTYKFPERIMKPGDVIYFGIPSDLSKKPINFVVMGHRQDPQEERGFDAQKKWDEVPGLSSFQVLTNKNEWRYWSGDSSGNQGAKFAEVRTSPEMENLYEWMDTGTADLNLNEHSLDPVRPEVMRVVNVGKDLVRLSEVTLKMQPDQFDHKIETIFTKGSEFHAQAARKPKLGGGQSRGGLFPGAVRLGGNNSALKLSKGWELIDNETLSIPLPEGKEITSIEVIGGDSHPDGIKNKDGGYGTPGWARLHMGIGSSPQDADWFVKNENVPPEGLMLGSVTDCERKTHKGEKIFIRGTEDILYVMGVRIGLKN